PGRCGPPGVGERRGAGGDRGGHAHRGGEARRVAGARRVGADRQPHGAGRQPLPGVRRGAVRRRGRPPDGGRAGDGRDRSRTLVLRGATDMVLDRGRGAGRAVGRDPAVAGGGRPGPPRGEPPVIERSRLRALVRTLLDLAALGAALAFLVSYFPASVMLSTTTTNGGDMASHVYAAAYLRDVLLPHGRVTGWCPGNYCGFPLFQFYFPLPFIAIALASYVIPFNVAFKLRTQLGPFLLPVCAYLSLLWAGFTSLAELVSLRGWWRRMGTLVAVHGLAILLLGFWLVPLLAYTPWTTVYSYVWIINSWREIVPPILWPAAIVAVVTALA